MTHRCMYGGRAPLPRQLPGGGAFPVPGRHMMRRSKYTEETIKKIEQAIRLGSTYRLAAFQNVDFVGVVDG